MSYVYVQSGYWPFLIDRQTDRQTTLWCQ